jgi:hypothetical protein
MKTLMKLSLMQLVFGIVLAQAEIRVYNDPVSYTTRTMIPDNSVSLYNNTLTLTNADIIVDGQMEYAGGEIILINSRIIVHGGLKINPGVVITETGASGIIACSDPNVPNQKGRVEINGEPARPIEVLSDYADEDYSFIRIDPNSSPASSIKYVHFYGGWSNIVCSDMRLNEPIYGCWFIEGEYPLYQYGRGCEINCVNGHRYVNLIWKKDLLWPTRKKIASDRNN